MPLHFLWGDEDYLIEHSIKEIKEKVLKGEVNDLNYKKVDSPDYALFLELLKTNAMMFGDLVVEIKCQNYFLTSKNKKELDEKQVSALIDALKNISQNVHIILVCPTPRGEKKKPDSRKKLYKEIQKITTPKEFPSYKNYEEYKLVPIIKKMANEKGIKINDSDCSFLIQTTGSSLRDLNTQLEKLKLLAYPDTTITTEMIKKIATTTIDVFSIVDFILKKDYLSAIDLIANIIEKEHYLPSFMLIQTMINNLLKTKIFSLSMSSFDIARQTGQNEFVVKKNIEKIAKVETKELIRLKTNLTIVDYLIKNGTINNPLTAYEIAFLEDNAGENL